MIIIYIVKFKQPITELWKNDRSPFRIPQVNTFRNCVRMGLKSFKYLSYQPNTSSYQEKIYIFICDNLNLNVLQMWWIYFLSNLAVSWISGNASAWSSSLQSYIYYTTIRGIHLLSLISVFQTFATKPYPLDKVQTNPPSAFPCLSIFCHCCDS